MENLLTLIDDLSRRSAQVLRDALPEQAAAVPAELAVQPAARAEFGDLQIASCLQLARPLGKKPRDLAQLVSAGLLGHPALAKTEIAGPGYVNLFLKNEWLAGCVAALTRDPALGVRRACAGQGLVLDF